MSKDTEAIVKAISESQNVYTLFDELSIAASLVSLILALLAIYLTLRFRKEAENLNRETSSLLTEIKIESEVISKFAWTELSKYGEHMRGNSMEKIGSESDFPKIETAKSDAHMGKKEKKKKS